jgi:hypothetical protein
METGWFHKIIWMEKINSLAALLQLIVGTNAEEALEEAKGVV